MEQIVESSIKKYPEYSKKYIDLNKKLSSVDKEDIRVILNETFSPLDSKFSESKYPLLKYFMYTEYKTNFKEALKKEEEYMSNYRYPLLNIYLNHSNDQKMLKYLPSFNDFNNYMLENYSYHITRENAKKTSLSNTEYDGNKFDNFKNSWEKIYQFATEYKSNKMEPRNLSKDDKLIYFLIDDNENEYGMHIAAAYQRFISWQNKFLLPIIESSQFNGILYYYIENMKKKIPIQEANTNQILSIDDCFKNSNYKNFDDLIYTFTKRDIYNKDQINYRNYNKFKYDFAKIEEELGKLILPEKCLFEDSDKLNFVIFLEEGFRGGRSEIFNKFYKKYSQVDLKDEEKKKISSDIQKIYDEDNNNLIKFFGSMQLLMFYLSNNIFSQDKDLQTIIKDKPEYLRLNEKCEKFFLDNNFKINQFINLFFYIEHLLFEELCLTLQEKYKVEIDEKIISDIINKLKKEKGDNMIFWKELAAAVRRFISRYLLGEKQNTDMKEDNSLENNLSRKDLWREKFENLETLINEKIGKFKIKVGQAFHFYKIIGEEDQNSITPINKKEEEKDTIDGGFIDEDERRELEEYDRIKIEDDFLAS